MQLLENIIKNNERIPPSKILTIPQILMPLKPSNSDYKTLNFIEKHFKKSKILYTILFGVCDINNLELYPDGMLGLRLNQFYSIKAYLEEE